ncbi:MAG: hypothetical protein GX213_15380, partial [Clostridiaceae bacterium]|nr:hypothetical protein [Clostridiaceae bacterium]
YYNQYYGKAYFQNKSRASADVNTKQTPNIPAEDENIKETVESSPIYKTTPENDAPVFPFNSDNLITGIVFSEILGKPKGRRKGW